VLARLVVDQVAARRPWLETNPRLTWSQLLDECRALMGVPPVRLLRTRAHVTPLALGIGSPAIVIPETADAWAMERRRAVLLHELAHIERRDCLTQTLASLTCAVYWIHPGAWWAAKRLQVEREFACDDRVLDLGAGSRDYAGHLLEIAYRLGSGRTPALAVGMARRGQLEGRLLAVLDAARNRRVPSAPGRLIASVAALAVVLPLAALTTSTHVQPPSCRCSTKPPPRRQRPSRRVQRRSPVHRRRPRRMRQPRAGRGRSSLRRKPAGCTSNCGRGTRTTAGRSRCRHSRGSRHRRAARSPSR
jgi:hypothetical protein